MSQVISQLDSWCDDMKAMTISVVPAQAEKVLPLHNENTSQVHQAMLEVMQHAQQLIQVNFQIIDRFEQNTYPFQTISRPFSRFRILIPLKFV